MFVHEGIDIKKTSVVGGFCFVAWEMCIAKKKYYIGQCFYTGFKFNNKMGSQSLGECVNAALKRSLEQFDAAMSVPEKQRKTTFGTELRADAEATISALHTRMRGMADCAKAEMTKERSVDSKNSDQLLGGQQVMLNILANNAIKAQLDASRRSLEQNPNSEEKRTKEAVALAASLSNTLFVPTTGKEDVNDKAMQCFKSEMASAGVQDQYKKCQESVLSSASEKDRGFDKLLQCAAERVLKANTIRKSCNEKTPGFVEGMGPLHRGYRALLDAQTDALEKARSIADPREYMRSVLVMPSLFQQSHYECDRENGWKCKRKGTEFGNPPASTFLQCASKCQDKCLIPTPFNTVSQLGENVMAAIPVDNNDPTDPSGACTRVAGCQGNPMTGAGFCIPDYNLPCLDPTDPQQCPRCDPNRTCVTPSHKFSDGTYCFSQGPGLPHAACCPAC